MKKIMLTICLAFLVGGCGEAMFFVATGEREKSRTDVKATARQQAVLIAIVKYLRDDTWTMIEVEKEIRYQEYLQRKQRQ